MQIDIGFGDAVTPQAREEELKTILAFPPPRIRIYPKETVVAEKFEAMIKLGIGNGRMKDFWDLRYLIKEFEFEGKLLQQAIRKTFANRKRKRNLVIKSRDFYKLTNTFVIGEVLKEYLNLYFRSQKTQT